MGAGRNVPTEAGRARSTGIDEGCRWAHPASVRTSRWGCVASMSVSHRTLALGGEQVRTIDHQCSRPAWDRIIARQCSRPAPIRVIDRHCSRPARVPVIDRHCSRPARVRIIDHQRSRPAWAPIIDHQCSRPTWVRIINPQHPRPTWVRIINHQHPRPDLHRSRTPSPRCPDRIWMRPATTSADPRPPGSSRFGRDIAPSPPDPTPPRTREGMGGPACGGKGNLFPFPYRQSAIAFWSSTC